MQQSLGLAAWDFGDAKLMIRADEPEAKNCG